MTVLVRRAGGAALVQAQPSLGLHLASDVWRFLNLPAEDASYGGLPARLDETLKPGAIRLTDD